MPVESLLLSVGLRFLIFSHPPARWLLKPLDSLFNLFAPQWWEELKSCPYCNGFWVFIFVDLALYPEKDLKGYFLMMGWAIFASLLSLFCWLFFSILRNHPSNKYEEEKP